MSGSEERHKTVRAVVIGCGRRGRAYSSFALDYPSRLEIVAHADPLPSRRAAFRRLHAEGSAGGEEVEGGWQAMVEAWRRDGLGQRLRADLAVVATPDRDHADAACAVAGLGLHVLLEKPMAVTPEDCQRIVDACERAGVMLAVCHVLRYTPANRLVKRLLDEGAIGRLCSVTHTEPIGNQHAAHSYVRGNWRREDESTSMLMAKSCHDVDLVRFYAGGARAERVASFGGLVHFRREDKPAEAGDAARCVDCAAEASCPYSAKRIYLDAVRRDGPGAKFCDALVDEVPDVENIGEAIRTGPYGVCVYEADNDVASHQAALFHFDNGVVASLMTTAFTEAVCARETRLYGTRGELRSLDGGKRIEVFDFCTRETTVYEPEGPPPGTRLLGHGGADYFLMDAVVRAVATGDESLIRTGPADALASHMLVFRAEEARKQ